ncbi:uncharacterized protein LOC113747104 [Larimichthys crocea]|uniref:uncharacterized protein LOC113747104 n=1 Tax=Larimichthys crocea TaxID=215358 RepID=UPI000F5EEA3C|nr:uncharacterized protein LOC113747104 [Larimichthys crocea]
MGRHCSFPGCKNTSGLHSFPADPDIRRQWMRALGLPDRDLPPRAGVCNRHFSRDCFSNLMEVEMGFTKVSVLKSHAVPEVARPEHFLPANLVPGGLELRPKPTREIGCQTEPVLTKHAAGQADIKPLRRSKAVQARAPNRSVSCDTGSLVAVPEILKVSSTPVKRTRSEVSPDESSPGVTDHTMKGTRSTDHSPSQFVVHEDRLMELFERCPLCTGSCVVSKTVTGTLLQVKQSCAHCQYLHQWSSQPAENI